MLLLALIVSLAIFQSLAPAAGETDGGAPPAVQFKRRLALVIGNGAYRSMIPLENPANDARDVCAALTAIGFKATCLLDVPSRRELREAIRLFSSQAGSGTETFFYYAGHGIQYRGENYLIPAEAQIWKEADIDFEGVGLSYLLDSLAEARSYPNVIVLDACRDNPLGTTPRVDIERGLARVDPPLGSVLVYATAPNKAALDGVGRNGLFTKHLLSRLAVPGLQLDEMFRQVAKGVEDEARTVYGFEQVPYRSSSYSGSYCLAGCEDPRVIDRIRAIEAQRAELNSKLDRAHEENAILRVQAQRGAAEIAKLEHRIARLVADESAKRAPAVEVAAELERARAELAAMKVEQVRRDAVERENQKRMTELEGLRAELQKQSAEIDEYRRKIRELEHARETARMQDEAVRQRGERRPAPPPVVPSF